MKRVIICMCCLILFLIPAFFGFAQTQQEGNAIWYNSDSLDLSASHARIPLGSQLRITNLENNKVVYVTVTGRIPSNPNYILDISEEPARLLELNNIGFTQIRLEVLDSLSADTVLPVEAATPLFTGTEPGTVENFDDIIPEITAVAISDDDFYEDEFEESLPVPVPPAAAAPASVPTPAPAPTPVPVQEKSPPQPPVRTQIPAGEPSNQQPEWVPVQTEQVPPPPPPPPRPPLAATPSPPPAPADSRVSPVESGSKVSVRVIVTVNGQEHVVEIPEAETVQSPVPPQPPAPPAPVPAAVVPPVPAPVIVNVPTGGPFANIIPQLPDPYSGGIFRVQVGAFHNSVFAQGAYDRLIAAGFSPAYERNGELYRVVIPGVRASEMAQVAQRLGAAGFAEAWIRREN